MSSLSGRPGAILLGDIGGTNARFALLADGTLGAAERFAGADFPTAEAAIAHYVESRPIRIAGAVLAAAGPVDDNRCELTNSDWVIDGDLLARRLGIAAGVRVVNDFAAVAWALPALGPDDVMIVGGGRARPGAPAVALGPGTGLGLACLVTAPGGPVAVETEGGHATLAAGNAREEAVISHLRGLFGHVSAERALSGQGLVNLYRAVVALDGFAAPERGPEQITAAALTGECPASAATLQLFCDLLGSFAGNVALTFGARGGVYVGGGIAPRLLEHLAGSSFRTRFEDKGRYRDYLSAIPTSIILHPDPAFLGLRTLAEHQWGSPAT